MVLVGLPLIVVAYDQQGVDGALAAVAGGATCLSGGLLALGVVNLFAGPQWVLAGMMIGMFLRAGLPLAVAVLVQLGGGRFAEAGFLWYLVPFYLVALAADTVLTVAQVRASQPYRTSTKAPTPTT